MKQSSRSLPSLESRANRDPGDPASMVFQPSFVSSSLLLGLLLGLTFLIRVLRLDQPIVENYVGRQIPTAMVARNLERGSGFLRPQLDTGPFPNFFLVEPPLYEQLAVLVSKITGLTLQEAGRLLSAAGMTIAAWGLFSLARTREGNSVALFCALAFTAFPVTIRYGRSFQPDALMLGSLIAGLAVWENASRSQLAARRVTGNLLAWLLMAFGLALKITSAYLLVPLVVCLSPGSWPRRAVLAGSLIIPALTWYLWANHLVNSGEGSRASADNRSIWLSVLAPTALLSAQVWASISRTLLWKSFTAIGAILAIGGFATDSGRGVRDRLWLAWCASAVMALLLLAAKLHHEYYWLALAPVLAVGVGRGLADVERRFRGGGWLIGAMFLVACGLQSRSTWETPREWIYLEEAARVVQKFVPADAWVVAPEALLFQGERRGCRLETTPAGCRRAAGEWGQQLPEEDAIALVEMYRSQGARYFADLGLKDAPSGGAQPERVALHEAIRRRYKVIVDLPAIVLAELQ